MKFRFFIAAALLLGLAVGCEQQEISTLDEIQVSQSYASIDVNGGSATININATEGWQVVDSSVPSWLTVSPMSGAAGTSQLTLSANATKATNEADIQIVCAGKTQHISVIQFAQKVDPVISSVAAVNAGADGVTYRVKGVVSSYDAGNSNAVLYGNWYLTDETGTLYIYGTLDKSGNTKGNPLTSWGIEVGDVVTIEGPKSTYNGTVELVDVAVISVVKSLLSIDEDTFNLPKEGGETLVKVAYKGKDLQVEPKADWISLGGINVKSDTTYVTLKVAANNGDPRTGEVHFASSIPGQASEATVTIAQAGVSGTLATPFTVAQAIEYCKTLTGPTAENFYVKGIVTKTLYTFSADYGNGTFWISDDGTDFVTENKKNTDNKDHDFECYSVLWMGNQPWTNADAQVAPGDEVIICGQLTNYNGTCETNGKKAYVYSINGCTVAGAGAGNQDYPFTVAGAVNALNGGLMNLDKDYFVKGICSKVLYTFSASYGTGTFWLSDDGTFNGAENGKSSTDYAHDFEAYSVYWLGNQPWVDGDDQVEVGDDVVVAGKLTLYNGLCETSSKKAYVYSVNRQTE